MMPKKISEERVHIALVGCGRISRNHVKAIAIHNESAKLVAICDRSHERMRDTKSLMIEEKLINQDGYKQAEEYESYEELIKAIKIGMLKVDLIVLATPSGIHAKQTIAAAEIGVHVCTEKPMATN